MRRIGRLEKPDGRGNKERKNEIVMRTKICSFCRYHRGENRNPHQPKPDRYKDKRMKGNQ